MRLSAPFFIPAAILVLLASSPLCHAATGTITISKCKMTDKTHSTETTSGLADASLSVEFKGEASCSCGSTNPTFAPTFTWDFGDGTSATGKTVSHTYGTSGAGNRTASLDVKCNCCGAEASAGGLSVAAITGIGVTKIGDIDNPTNNGRLCFDAVRTVTARALPVGVNGSDRIDWVMVLVEFVCLANTNNGSLPSPSPWPTTNSAWGPNTLSASIDGSYPALPGQNGELILTGTPSWLFEEKSIKVFFDVLGSQNPGTGSPKPKNWFHYWTQTSANAGTMHYSSSGSYCAWDAPSYTCYLDDGCCGSYPTPVVGKNAGTTLFAIDTFAWSARHEWRHHQCLLAWWGSGGWDANRDPDSDAIPSLPDPPNTEGSIGAGGGGPFSTSTKDTYTDDGNLVNDNERYTVFTQADWTVESAKGQDWAHPGSQWP